MTTIQVNITLTSTGVVEWTMNFPSTDEANVWVAQYESTSTWGKPQRVLVANEQGEVVDTDGSTPDLTKAIATGTMVDAQGVTVNTYTMPADFTVTQTDITAQVEDAAAMELALQCQAVGAKCIARVAVINNAKFAAGTLTIEQVQAMASDPTLIAINTLLQTGALATAKAMMEAYTGAYYTSADIAQIVAVITASGLVPAS